MFASNKTKGKTPRTAGVARQDYLRPAAVKAGVIPTDYRHRFGWRNLRHSLAGNVLRSERRESAAHPEHAEALQAGHHFDLHAPGQLCADRGAGQVPGGYQRGANSQLGEPWVGAWVGGGFWEG